MLPFIYLGLSDRVGVEFDLAEVVTGGHELVVVGPGAGVEVGAVDRLGPDPDRVEREEAGLAGPLHVPHGDWVSDLTADGRVP